VEALGRLFDIGVGFAPVELNTADGATGKRIAMVGADAVTIVAFMDVAASGTDNLTFDIQQHTAYTGGTSKDLDADPSTGAAGSVGIDHFYIKAETALDNDEAWVRVSQTEASEVVVAGATYAAMQKLVVIEVASSQLAEGFTHLSVACTAGNVNQLGACLYFTHELRRQRKPTSLPNLLRTNAANA